MAFDPIGPKFIILPQTLCMSFLNYNTRCNSYKSLLKMISFVKIGVRFSELCLRFVFGPIGPKSSYLAQTACEFHYGIIILLNTISTRFFLKVPQKSLLGLSPVNLKMVWTNQLLYQKNLKTLEKSSPWL